MISDRFIDHIAETVRFEAGKDNPVLETSYTVNGYIILLHDNRIDDSCNSYYYAGKGKEPVYNPNRAEFYETQKQAWDAIIAEKVRPYSDTELPKVVFCGSLYFITEKEVSYE